MSYQSRRDKILKWRHDNPGKRSWQEHKHRLKIKVEVLTHYGKGVCACVACGEDRLPCLTIDHINNDGYKEKRGGYNLHLRLRREGYPADLQTLCANCQFLKRDLYNTYQLELKYGKEEKEDE